MTARPKEIQETIEWLRAPDCNMAVHTYGSPMRPCPAGKIAMLAGMCTGHPNGSLNRHDIMSALRPLGVTRKMQGAIELLTDTTSDPIAVADYLERTFPVAA